MLDENKSTENLIEELIEARRKIDELEVFQQSMREKESLYRQVVDKTDEAILVIQDGLIKFANETASRVTGYSNKEGITSDAIAEFVHPDDREMLRQYHEKRLKGDKPHYHYPFRFIRKDGSVAWAEMNSSLIMWEGRPAALYIMTGITERKRAEQALEESRDILNVIIGSLPVGMLYVDSRERVVFANKTFRSWWRMPDLDLSGQTVSDILGEHYTFIQGAVKNALAGQETSYIRRVKYKDGITRDIVASYAPHMGHDGDVKGFACLIEDVSQLKQAERELRESEQRLELALRGGELGLWDWDLKTGRAIWDERATLMMGYGAGELDPHVGTWKRTVHPDDWNAIAEVLNGHMQGRLPSFDSEFRMRVKSGEWRWYQARGKIVEYDFDGKPLRITGTILDVTERKEAEEALRNSEESFRRIVEGAPEPVFVQTGGVFAYLNSPALKLFGANSNEDLLGKPVMDRFHPRIHERAKQRIQKLNIEKEHVDSLEQPWIRMDGSEVAVEVSAVPINFRGQDGALVFAHDLTTKKLAEQEKRNLQNQLIQAQKMEALGTLVGGIAHDFNNMLQTILGHSELLMMDETLNKKTLGAIQTIIDTGKGGAELVKKLFSFGLQSSSLAVDMDLNHQIRELGELISRTLPQVVALEFDLTQAHATIHGDPSQIDQVIMNLAINASDAMPNGGRLRLVTRVVTLDDDYCRLHHGLQSGQYVMLSVVDTGKGMDKETLPRIFDPFFSTKQRGPTRGTGLGLAVVKGIIEKNRGHITCESQPGKGTEFRIYFPSAPVNYEPDEEKGVSSGSDQPDTILLVEDSKSVAEMAQRVLAKAGYSVIVARNGNDAIDVLKSGKQPLNLVILDLTMLKETGKDSLLDLMRDSPSLKVLISSAVSPTEELQEEMSRFVTGFLQKPFAVVELLAAVESALGR